MTDRPKLTALADRAGILREYLNYNGTEHRVTSNDTRLALLAAMGFDASTEQSAGAAIDALDDAEQTQILDPVRVTQFPNSEMAMVSLRLPSDLSTSWEWVLELQEESGPVHRAEGHATREGERATMELPLPARPDPGYHRLRAVFHAPGREYLREQDLIVTPATCRTIAETLGDRRLFGFWANLYTLRSRHNWGVGDLGDLKNLVAWADEIGAGFVGINPLHAGRNVESESSPYRPVSRLYRNTIYLNLDSIPELEHCAEARRILASSEFAAQLGAVRAANRVDYKRIGEMKRDVLRSLHGVFIERHRGKPTARGQAYTRYVDTQGQALVDFATFLALDHAFGGADPRARDPRHWPSEYRDPRSSQVQNFRQDHADEIDFHCYLQFELECQLADIARLAHALGLPIGLYQDVAIGTAPDGSDPWAFPGLFVDGASVGAPPDDLGPEGQNWGLPPINPLRLRDRGYQYWIRLLRSAFAHAGALRIDHVMGLSRQFWVPAGCSGSAGAYVRFPADDLFGILALESRRHHAIVIGEDLGTVPPGFAEMLERWGVLSTRVLYFERDHEGEFRSPGQYSNRAMVAVNTHDLPPLAGYWEGRDLTLRQEVGQIGGGEQLAAAQARRSQECDALLRVLRREGLIGEGEVASPVDRFAAVHALMARSPAPLFAVSLDDLAGETEPVNLPGVDPSRYPTWSRRMGIALEDIRVLPSAGRTLSTIRSERTDKRTERGRTG